MSPYLFLALTAAITIGAAGWQWLIRNRHRRALRRLAARLQMHYSAGDRFLLAGRVAESFPIAQATELRVFDLIYGIDGDVYRYLFTVDYTLEMAETRRTNSRRRGVAAFIEPRDRAAPSGPLSIRLAPDQMSIVEQYRHLSSQIIDRQSRP